jgi:hypothetical protein
MELVTESFKLVRYLINRPIKVYKNTFLSFDSAKRIGEYFERLGAEHVLLITFSPNGKTIVRKNIVGNYDFWKDAKVKKGDVILGDATNRYVFPISFSDTFGNRGIVNIGYLCVYRNISLSKQELEIVETLTSVLGNYFYKRLQETSRVSSSKFRFSCRKYNFSDKPAGTIIHKWIFTLYKTFDALSVFYLTLDEKICSVEYYKRDSINNFISNDNKIVPLDNVLQKKIKIHGNNDFIIKASECEVFLNYIKKFDRDIDDSTTLYFNVIRISEQQVGCWLFSYSRNQSVPFYFLKENLDFLNRKVGANFKFLYQRRTQKMVVNPIFKARNTVVDETLVFVLMPFTLEWSNRIFDKILKPTVESISGLKVKRADDLFGTDIMEDIWSSILQAKIIIADISERNANVFYELGICHALGKEVILITQNVADIPFDLNRYRHIVYKDNYDGYELLKKQLEGTIMDVLRR